MELHTDNGAAPAEVGEEIAVESGIDHGLDSLVDRIGRSLARGLVDALQELENHVAGETRRVGEALGQRLDSLQASVQDLTGALSDHQAASAVVQEQCRQLEAAAGSLQESDARQSGELEALRAESRDSAASLWGKIESLSGELNARLDEIGAVGSKLDQLHLTAETLGQRLDRQSETLRSLCATYAQRETELEQVVEGLVRLRSHSLARFAEAL